MNELSVNDALDDIESKPFDFIWEEWEEYKGDVPLWQHIFCGSIAGLMEHVFMYPLDTIKTYFQTNTNLKCKQNFEKCNLYNCYNNYKELNTYKNLHIDKRTFCSSIGCDNCINKSCNLENYCSNMKAIPNAIIKKNLSYMSAMEILKKKKKINKFYHINSQMSDKNINHIVNKKLQYNNYFNKRINKYLKNIKCGNSCYKYLLSLKNNSNIHNISRNKLHENLLYNSKNKKINYLKGNIHNVESNINKIVINKMNIFPIKNTICNIENNIQKKVHNIKREFPFSTNNIREKKKINLSRKIISKVILKKNKTKYHYKINYCKYALKSKMIRNYGNKKLKLLNTIANIKENDYMQLKKKKNFLLQTSLDKYANINRNNCYNHIKNNNNLTLINNIKNKCIHIMNKCYCTKNINNGLKNFFFHKLNFHNYLFLDGKNTYKMMLSSYLNYFKKKNCHNINNNIFRKIFIHQNDYSNLLDSQKKKNNLSAFLHVFQNMKHFVLNQFTHRNIKLENKTILKQNHLFPFLNNNKNILLSNIYFFTGNKKGNLFDRNIHISSKYNFYKNNNNNNIITRFSNNFKNINFKNILINKNRKGDIKLIRNNSSLIRNNFTNLYKGVNVVVLGCIPAHAMYFSTFEYSKKYFSSMSSNNSTIKFLNNNKSDAINYKLNDLNYFSIIISGFLATLAHDLIITPIDTLKQRIQLGINKNGLDSIKILQENGLRSLYLSLPITLIMNIPYQIIMICTNEQMKKIYFEYISGLNSSSKNSLENKYNIEENSIIKSKENNIPNVSIGDDIKSANDIKDYLKNNNDEVAINKLKEKNDREKLIKFHINQDIYSMNNIDKNRGNKYIQEEENEKKSKEEIFNKKNNSHILFKEIIKKLENNSNGHSENYDNNKIIESMNFDKRQYLDLKNIWMDNYKNDFFSKQFNHITSYFVCAGIGGGVAAILTNPFDVIKTRIQTECFNTRGFHFFKVVSNLYKKEGLGSFFKGSLARMALCIPASAISWGSYETMKRFFKIHFNTI